MIILLKKVDTNKYGYNWLEFDTINKTFNCGYSAVSSPKLPHDLVINVKTLKEYNKLCQSIISKHNYKLI